MELFGLFGFFGLFGVLELVAMAVLFLFLVIGCTVDRRMDNEAFKWWVVVVGIAVAVWYYWSPLATAGPSGIWETVTSLSFWTPALVYFGLGLVYCIPEFMMDVRRAAKFYKGEWNTFKNRTLQLPVFDDAGALIKVTDKRTDADTLPALLAKVRNAIGKVSKDAPQQEVTVSALLQRAQELKSLGVETEESYYVFREAERMLREFRGQYRFRNRIVQLSTEGLKPEPEINKVELAEHIAGWTIFWPFYAVALVIGDILAEFWNVVAEFFTTFAGRFVRFSFADVFKLG